APGFVLSGTPLVSDIGAHNVVLRSSNNVGSVDQAFTITVSGPSTLSSFSDLTGVVGSNFTITAPSSNSNGTFTYTSSDNAVASISGNTISPLLAGTTTITATQAADGYYTSADITCTLTVINCSTPVADLATLPNVTGECSATVSVIPTATSNCAGTLIGTTSDLLTYSTQGTHTITWTYDDGNGNVITQTQNVVIDDVTDPVRPTLADVTGECSATATAPTTSDNCSGTITGTTTDALSYSTQGIHIITWNFDDGNGNDIDVTQNVVIDDVTKPATPTLADVTGECSATATAPTTSDVCAGIITGTTSDALSYSTQGIHVITWNFDDGNGNEFDVTQNVVINDVTNPVVLTQDITVQLDAKGYASIVPADIDNSSSDNCSISTMSLDKAEFDVSDEGENTVTLTVTDLNANSSSATALVTITSHVPVVSASQTFSVSEDASNGTSIGTLLATDPLDGTSFGEWIIMTGNEDKLFALNPSTGEISLADNSKLDYELKKTYTLGICVSDGIRISEEEDVMILVKDINERPIAIAGENQTVADNSIVKLNAWSSYDPDGDYLDFIWYAPEGIKLSHIHDPMPTFIAPDVSTLTDYVFTLIVNDGELYSEEVSVTISVDNVTGIEEIDSEEVNVSLYPNPSKGAFYLELNKRPVNAATLSIISLSGQAAYSQKLYEKKTFFNLSLKSGMYILKIELDEEIIMKKIIILQD
uniref:T9SS type A sorting domain-containing protein n=1 Tax=Ancylomarina sp. TaxID=1970196 RepID=UPI0035668F71